MKDERFCRSLCRQPEGAFVARVCGEEVAGAFRQVLLFGLVVFLDEEMAALDCNCEHHTRRKRVFAGDAVELLGGERGLLMLLEFGRRRKLIVRRVVFPIEGKCGWSEQ